VGVPTATFRRQAERSEEQGATQTSLGQPNLTETKWSNYNPVLNFEKKQQKNKNKKMSNN